jgi:very-short-patch-repair endonuclease
VDAVIARLARAGDGVVSRSELLDAGVSIDAIRHRLGAQRLHPCFRGVYAVGHDVVSLRGRARAALLSSNGDAVLSHLWSIAVHGVRRGPPAEVDLIGPRGVARSQPGIRLHEARRLDPRDVTIRHGLRTTTVERALLDLADTLAPNELERLLDEAIGLRKTTPPKLAALLARSPGRRGTGTLRELLERDYSVRTRQEFERRMLTFIRAIRVAHPRLNDPFGPYFLDFHWPAARYVIEADSRAWHSTRARQKQDAAKDRYLRDRDVEVRRVRFWELDDEPLALAAEVGATIAVRTLAPPHRPPAPRL